MRPAGTPCIIRGDVKKLEKIIQRNSCPSVVRPNTLPVAKCEGSPPSTAMVGDVEAASIVEEGGVIVAVLMFATSLTGIGVSGVNVLLTPGDGAKHSRVSLTCMLPTK